MNVYELQKQEIRVKFIPVLMDVMKVKKRMSQSMLKSKF